MSGGKGNIVRTVIGANSKEASKIRLSATDGNLNFFSPKNVVTQGKENGVLFKNYEQTEEECDKGIIKINSIVVGKAKRDPGYNFDGTRAEDMYYADEPERSASIKKDPMFLESDAILGACLDQLMTSLSIGDMETVALEMSSRFQKGTGGMYTSEILDKKIANHSQFVNYHYTFLEKLKQELQKVSFDPNKMDIIPMSLLHFSSFWDKVSGLGITVHQVWSVKAELKDYKYNKCTQRWSSKLLYTFYDHFGLDWDDIVKHGEDRVPQYHTGDFFKAWYILQHYRSAKPFITKIEREVMIN